MSIVEYVSCFSEEDLKFFFGKKGEALNCLFQDDLDYQNPEFIENINAFVSDHNDFTDQIKDVVHTLQNIDSQLVVNGLRHSVRKNKTFKKFLKLLCSPHDTGAGIRFLKPEARLKYRKNKRTEVADLRVISKRGKDIWDAQPSNLDEFVPGQNPYEKEIKLAKSKIEAYKSLGSFSLAEVVEKGLAQKLPLEKYKDFNRITVTNACVIMAKMMGLTLHAMHPQHDSQSRYWSIIADALFLELNDHTEKLFYQPKIYPFYGMKYLASQKVMDMVESLSDDFDNFLVVVPGFSYNLSYPPFNYKIDGKLRSADTLENANRAIEVDLIKKNIIKPVTLGERDNKCYLLGDGNESWF